MTDTMMREVSPDGATGPDEVQYGTRWRRSALLIMPAVVLVGVISGAVVRGTLALDLATQSGGLSVPVTGAHVTAAAVHPMVQTVHEPDGSAASHWYLGVEASTGTVDSLCATQPFDVLGSTFTLKVIVRGPINATGLVLALNKADINTLALDGNPLILNETASDLKLGNNGPPSKGDPNLFGIQVDSGDVDAVSALVHTATITNVGTAGVAIDFVAGVATC